MINSSNTVKYVLRPGFVGMRGQWSDDYGMHDHEYTPPPPLADSQNQRECFKRFFHKTLPRVSRVISQDVLVSA